MVAEGEIRDALSIVTLQAAQLLHLQGRLLPAPTAGEPR